MISLAPYDPFDNFCTQGNRGPKKKNSHFGGKRKPRESYDDIVKENELLEKYYKVSEKKSN